MQIDKNRIKEILNNMGLSTNRIEAISNALSDPSILIDEKKAKKAVENEIKTAIKEDIVDKIEIFKED